MPKRRRNTIHFSQDEQASLKLESARLTPNQTLALAREHQDAAELSTAIADTASTLLDPSNFPVGPINLDFALQYWAYDAEQHVKIAEELLSVCGHELLRDILDQKE